MDYMHTFYLIVAVVLLLVSFFVMTFLVLGGTMVGFVLAGFMRIVGHWKGRNERDYSGGSGSGMGSISVLGE